MKITIYGLGAIGSNLLVQLSKQYPDFEFTGIDFDKVEERNIRTQAYFIEHVGSPKTAAMRTILARFNRRPKYTPLNHKLTRAVDTGLMVDELSIDCFDNTESRKLLKSSSGHMLHVGFSPFYTAECIWNEDYEVPNDVDTRQADICSMTDAVPFIHYIVNAAALNVSHWLETKQKRNFIVTGKTKMSWL